MEDKEHQTFLHRTQDLIANATTSVPPEFNNWRCNSLVSVVSPSICPSSCSTASTTNRSLAISNPHWPRRASTSTSRHLSHSWHLKKRRWKILRSQSQVKLLIANLFQIMHWGMIMILAKSYCNFSTSYT